MTDESPRETETRNLPSVSIPTPSRGKGLEKYLAAIQSFPMLDADEEYMLAARWQEYGDPEAARRLITSHLRLVAKIAFGFRGYKLPMEDLISEGNLGLMRAVQKFDPERGFRLSTYARWWVRACIQEYILSSWSLVKLGTTAAQKKLFFNLQKLKSQINAIEEGDLPPEAVAHIARELQVGEHEVIEMNRRLQGPIKSLNMPVRHDSDLEGIDLLESNTPGPEEGVSEAEEHETRMELMREALATLTDREQHIFIERFLNDPPKLLEELGGEYGISRERVRQIQERAFEKVQAHVLDAAIRMGIAEREDSPDDPKAATGKRRKQHTP